MPLYTNFIIFLFVFTLCVSGTFNNKEGIQKIITQHVEVKKLLANRARSVAQQPRYVEATCAATCAADSDCLSTLASDGTYTSRICSEGGVCVNTPAPSVALGGTCSSDDDCTEGFCSSSSKCQNPVTSGCTCSSTADCTVATTCSTSGVCIPNRLNGQSCQSTAQCFGACIGGVCTQVGLGTSCITSIGCSAGLFCNVLNKCATITGNTCGTGNTQGYCAPLASGRQEGVCFPLSNNLDGTCVYLYGKKAGESCHAPATIFGYIECDAFSACRQSPNGGAYSCVATTPGSSCATYTECLAYTSQDCVCAVGASSPSCQVIIQPACVPAANIQYECLYGCNPDINIALANYTCAKNCLNDYTETCCQICPPTTNGVIYDVQGTCGQTVQGVDCCTPYGNCYTESFSTFCGTPSNTTITATATTTGGKATSTTSKSTSTSTSKSTTSTSTSTSGRVSTSSTSTTSVPISTASLSSLQIGVVVALIITNILL